MTKQRLKRRGSKPGVKRGPYKRGTVDWFIEQKFLELAAHYGDIETLEFHVLSNLINEARFLLTGKERRTRGGMLVRPVWIADAMLNDNTPLILVDPEDDDPDGGVIDQLILTDLKPGTSRTTLTRRVERVRNRLIKQGKLPRFIGPRTFKQSRITEFFASRDDSEDKRKVAKRVAALKPAKKTVD